MKTLQSKTLQRLKAHLRPGKVYRREQLSRWSTAVDRHLRQLVEEGTLRRLSGGLYLYPKSTVFGAAPAKDAELVSSFLKDNRFLLATPNAYNGLGVGTTQLYDKTVVYNHKRHGEFALGGRVFDFRVKPAFPRKLSREFLLVDLMNNVDRLSENKKYVLARVKKDVLTRVKDGSADLDARKLQRAARNYGNVRTKKLVANALGASNGD